MRYTNKKNAYYAVLSEDKTVAVIYASGGQIKASFSVKIEEDKAILIDSVSHAVIPIYEDSRVVEVLPFEYETKSCTLSVDIVTEDESVVNFNAKLSELVNRDFCRGGHHHNRPFVDDYATKSELKEEAKIRRLRDNEIKSMIGTLNDGSDSIASNLSQLEVKLNDEIERARSKDSLHSSKLKDITNELCQLQHKLNDNFSMLSYLIREERDSRISSLDEIYSQLEHMKADNAKIFVQMSKLDEEFRSERNRVNGKISQLGEMIELESSERQKEDTRLCESVHRNEERIDKAHHELVHERNRATHAESDIIECIKVEADERLKGDAEMRQYVDEKIANLVSSVSQIASALRDKINLVEARL